VCFREGIVLGEEKFLQGKGKGQGVGKPGGCDRDGSGCGKGPDEWNLLSTPWSGADPVNQNRTLRKFRVIWVDTVGSACSPRMHYVGSVRTMPGSVWVNPLSTEDKRMIQAMQIIDQEDVDPSKKRAEPASKTNEDSNGLQGTSSKKKMKTIAA